MTEAGFEKIKENREISIFLHKSREVVHAAAETVIDAEPEKVLEKIIDYKGQQKFVDRISECRILDRGKNSLLVYMHLNLPIISDRDYTLFVTFDRMKNPLTVRYRTAEQFGPAERDGIVRVTKHEGSWQLTPLAGGKKTKIRFQVKIDMAGWLPKWLYRRGTAEEIPEVIESIRTLVGHEM